MKRILTLLVLVILHHHAQAQVRLYYKINQQPSLDVGNDCGCLRAVSFKLSEIEGSNSLLIDRNDEREKTGFLGANCQEKASAQRDVNPFSLGSGFINAQSAPNALKADIYVWSPGLSGITGNYSLTQNLDKSGNYLKSRISASSYPGCGLGASFDGEFVYVPENMASPVLLTVNTNGVISGTSASFSAPQFLKSNFPPEKVRWRILDNERTLGSSQGHNFTFDMSLESKCHAIQAVAYVDEDGYSWISKPLTFEFHPETNVNLNIVSPPCLESQSSNDSSKYKGKIELINKTTQDVFKVATFDKDNNQQDYTLDKVVPILYKFDVDKSPYSFKIERDLGNDLSACPVWFEKIKLYYPTPISINGAQFIDIQCFNQKAKLGITIEGNTNLYTLSYGDSSKIISKGQATNIALMTKSRSYNFEIVDENGCKYDQPISYTASEPSKLEATIQIDTAVCFKGNAQVKILASGGTVYDNIDPYRYAFWPTTGTQLSSSYFTKGGVTVYPRVYDKNNCAYNFPTMTLSNPKDFKLKILEHKDNICPRAYEGKIIVGTFSDDQRYTYSCAIGNNGFSKNFLFDSLPSANYKIRVQNQNGCMKDTMLTISQPPIIQITQKALDSVRCYGESNGSIELNITGGTGKKSINKDNEDIWSLGSTYTFTHQFDSLPESTYWFHVIDSLGCRDSASYSLTSKSHIKHTSSTRNPSCDESSDGDIFIGVSGGKQPYTNSWLTNPELGSKLQHASLPKGMYILESIDKLQCVKIDTFELVAPPALQVNLEGYPLLCKNQSLTLDAGPGSTYKWGASNGFTGNIRKVTVYQSGTYWVEVTNQNGCKGRDTFLLKESDTELKADFWAATNVVKGDTVVLVNMNPKTDSITWTINPNYMMSVDKDYNRTSQQVVFTAYGENDVEMVAYYKGCRDIKRQRILVIDASERNKYDKAIGIKTSVINTCHLFPNPNDGTFEIEIELNEKGIPLALALSSMATGTVLKTLDWKIYPDGKIKFEEELPEGAYVIHVKARDEIVALRFLVAYD